MRQQPGARGNLGLVIRAIDVFMALMSESVPLQIGPGPSAMFFAESVHSEKFQMASRQDDFHKVLYLQGGRASLEWNDRPAEARSAGSFWIIPARCQHRLVDHAPSVILLLCLAESLLERDDELREVWRLLVNKRGHEGDVGHHGATQLERLWRRALLEQCLLQPGVRAVVKTEVLRLLTTLLRIPQKRATDSAGSRVDQIGREIETSFFEPWNVDLAAERAGLSRRHFTQLFKERTGETLVVRLTRLRLRQAELLLRSNRHSVTGAAFAAGFEDLSHFYRLFRKAHGCAPGCWQDRQRTVP